MKNEGYPEGCTDDNVGEQMGGGGGGGGGGGVFSNALMSRLFRLILPS